MIPNTLSQTLQAWLLSSFEEALLAAIEAGLNLKLFFAMVVLCDAAVFCSKHVLKQVPKEVN